MDLWKIPSISSLDSWNKVPFLHFWLSPLAPNIFFSVLNNQGNNNNINNNNNNNINNCPRNRPNSLLRSPSIFFGVFQPFFWLEVSREGFAWAVWNVLICLHIEASALYCSMHVVMVLIFNPVVTSSFLFLYNKQEPPIILRKRTYATLNWRSSWIINFNIN